MASYGFRPCDDAATDFINDCVEQANNVRKEYEPQWRENWANYRVESTYGTQTPNKTYPMASATGSRMDMSPINFLKTPESHQGVNTLRALLLSALFGVRDYVQADPNGDEDVMGAKKVSKLVMYGLERPGNFRTNFEVLGDGLICGLGSYSALWKTVTKLVPRRIPVPDPSGMSPDGFLRNPATGSIMTVLQNVQAPVYDDPTLTTDELFDTWFDPAANRFDELNWKVKRFRIRDEVLLDLMQDPDWDAEGIGEVLTCDPGEVRSGNDRGDSPKLTTENLTEEDIKDVKEYGYYGGWYFEGTIPREVADKINEGRQTPIDASGTVIIRTINGIVVQAIQSPQRNGRIQGGVLTVLPSGRGIYGIAPLTIIRYLQDVSDTQLILTVQALIESVYQNYLVGGENGPTFARDLETRRPRQAFVLQGEVEQVVPLPKDYSGLQAAVAALNLISQTMRNAMNARDPVQGIQKQTGEAETATSTQIVANAALNNTDQLAVLIERDELPVQGQLINDLYYVNLDDEGKVFRRIGETDPTTVSFFDIDSTGDITFCGARMLLSRQGRANQFRDFAQLILSNPLTAAMMDWHAFVQRYGDEALDVRGLEALMINDPEEIVARLMAQGMANLPGKAVGNDGGGEGPGGGAPPEKQRMNTGNGGKTGGPPGSTEGEAQ